MYVDANLAISTFIDLIIRLSAAHVNSIALSLTYSYKLVIGTDIVRRCSFQLQFLTGNESANFFATFSSPFKSLGSG